MLGALHGRAYCISPVCCASEVSIEVAVICRLELVSDRAENTMLHRDSRKAENTLSSNVDGRDKQTGGITVHLESHDLMLSMLYILVISQDI